jgi:hypothetical protein
MVEYSGYIPVKPIDWTAKTSEISNKFLETYYDREKQRRDQQAEVDDVISGFNKFETTNSQTFNNFILNGSQSAKSYIQAQNDLFKKGIIDQNTLKRNLQNSREGFSNLKILTDGVNERIRIGTERMNNGKASKMEQFIQDNIFDIIDVSNKQFIQDENGNGYIVSTDGKTKISTKSLNNTLNQFIDTPDIESDVDKAVQGLGVGALNMKDGRYAISPKLLGNWEKTKSMIAKDILASPQKAANVLAMQLGYTFTMDPEEAKKDSNKILLSLDPNGAYVPNLTDAQKADANKIVEETIETRVDFKKENVDPNERAKIALENRNLDLAFAKLNAEQQAKEEPFFLRMKTINDILSGSRSGMAAIQGRPLAYTDALGVEGGKPGDDPKKLYAGYVIERVKKDGPDNYSVTMKIGSGKDIKRKVFKYTKRGLVSDLNQVLNTVKGSGELNNEKILSLYDMGIGGTSTTTTTGVAPGDAIFPEKK